MIQRFLIALVALLTAGTLSAGTITLTAEVSCPTSSSIYLYRLGGLHFEPVMMAQIVEGKATFTIPEQDWQFFYLGFSDTDILPLILGKETGVIVQVDCTKMNASTVSASAINDAYQEMKGTMNGLKNRANQVSKKYNRQLQTGDIPVEFSEEMTKIDRLKLQMLEEYQRTNPFFARILELNTYLSYHIQPSDYTSELDFFANEYFHFVDFEKYNLSYQPWVYEAFKGYANTLAGTKMPAEMLQEYIGKTLAKVPTNQQTYQLALSGILRGVEKANPSAFAYYAGIYIDKYKETYPEPVLALERQLDLISRFVQGGVAPNFTQNDPQGNPVSLSDFRGKVLLVDFWASWCGPCRKENPNVVRLYQQYKDKGFEVLGVSLDSKQDRWLDAIEKDGLTWTHVSDLKGWQNEVAGMYSVTSIPHTVLLDAEGKILGRNLRGPALEQKLAEVFGN